MKRSFAAALALTFVTSTSAFAQQLEAPTAADKPTPAPSESPGDAAASTTKTKAYPTPGMPAKTSAVKAASPSPAAKPAAATKAPAAPATARPLTGNAEAQIRQIEDSYVAAAMNHNIALIEPYTADDFVFTDPTGRVMNKRAATADFKKDTDTYSSVKNEGLKVRKIEPNVYVVTGVLHEIGKDKSGAAFDRRLCFTDTLVNRHGRWLVVATHLSPVSRR